jgi:hypothetical protein
MTLHGVEEAAGSAGQNMTWTNARPIFTALRAESSGKAKHGGLVAIGDEGSNSGTDSDSGDDNGALQGPKSKKQKRASHRVHLRAPEIAAPDAAAISHPSHGCSSTLSLPPARTPLHLTPLSA